MCTALLSNPELRRSIIELGEQTHDFRDLSALSQHELPTVEKLISLYGLLGRSVVPGGSVPSNWYEASLQAGLDFVFELYDASDPGQQLQAPVVLTEIIPDQIKHFAETTLLMCGVSDPLLHGNRLAHDYLKALPGNHLVIYREYEGTHAFHGFPAGWARFIGYDWKKNALLATYDILAVLTNGKFDRQAHHDVLEQMEFPRDLSPLLVFPVTFCVGIGVLACMQLLFIVLFAEETSS